MKIRKDGREGRGENWSITGIAVAVMFCAIFFLIFTLYGRHNAEYSEYIDVFSKNYLQEMISLMEEPYSRMIDSKCFAAMEIDSYLEKEAGKREYSLMQFEKFFAYTISSLGAEDIIAINDQGVYLTMGGEKGRLGIGDGLLTLFGDKKPVVEYINWRLRKQAILVAVPVESFIMDGINYGAIGLIYDIKEINDLFDLDSFEGRIEMYLMDDHGVVLFAGGEVMDPVGTDINIFRKYADEKFIDKAAEWRALSDLAEGRSDTLVVGKDEDYYFSYMPVNGGDYSIACEVSVALTQNVMKDYQLSLSHNIVYIVIFMTAIFVMASFLLLRAYNRERMYAIVHRGKEELAKQNIALERARIATEEAFHTAEQANRSKSEFLSYMSHDIRTPMNAIVGFSALLNRDAENPEKVREYTKKITASSQHLLCLINDVLDISKIESGKTTLNLSEENIADIVEGLDTIVRPQMKAKGHSFEVAVHDIKHEDIIVDKLRLNQILLNILSNSVKYTGEGGTVRFSLREVQQGSKNYAKYQFVIQDNGYGMSAEFADNIFEAFAREDTPENNNVQGTGLGMAITKNLVELMGGRIVVETELGKGSKFTVELELQISERDGNQKFWENNGLLKLLVVDDEETVCKNVCDNMSGIGVTTEYALDGEAAVRMIKRAEAEGQQYNVVLLDRRMPGMDGIETAKEIRKLAMSSAPILVLTSHDWIDVKGELKEAGIDSFLPKPFFVTSLRKSLEGVLNAADDEPEAEKKGILNGMKILLAEDNETNAEILSDLLAIYGAVCKVCRNGKEALEEFERSVPGQYDLILMDVQMPKMTGYEATRAIRESGHVLANTMPIIAMTGNAFAEDICAALEAGMNAHVAKPVDMEVLEETVRMVLTGEKA